MAFPLLNDIEPSWADIGLIIPIYTGPTFKTEEITAVKWSDKINVGVRTSPDGRKRSATTGIYEPEASITLYRSSARKFQRALALSSVPFGGKISRVKFDILISHTPPGEADIYKVAIIGCRVTGRAGDYKQGTDPDTVEIPLFVGSIKDDGIEL